MPDNVSYWYHGRMNEKYSASLAEGARVMPG